MTGGALRVQARGNVLFIEDFDDRAEPAPAIAEAPVILAPSYTADDIEAAREEGRLAALDDHAAVQAGLCTAALAAIADRLDTAREHAQAAAARNADDIAGAMLALLKLALPATAARLASDEVCALTSMLLPPLSREPGVQVLVHPDVREAVEDSLQRTLSRSHDVTVGEDAALAPSDVTITWHDGTARRDWDALWQQLREALAPFPLPDDLRALTACAPEEKHGG